MFVFYDLETTGTSPAFDQPLQFAAILTDDKFNQIERIGQLIIMTAGDDCQTVEGSNPSTKLSGRA